MRHLILGAIALAGMFATAAQAQTQYIWCSLLDSGRNSTAFYSSTFPGAYSNQMGISNAFTAFVHAHYPNVQGVGSCSFERSESLARGARDQSASTSRMVGYKRIEFTNWSY